jgi:HEAT repeat protein
MEQFLAAKNYEAAARLIRGLRADMERKEEAFSKVQLRTIQEVLDAHLGNRGIKKLINTLRQTKGESEEFEELVTYFRALGPQAIVSLLNALEEEQSRYVRLLICNALSRMGVTGVAPVGERLDHKEWYVARNAASILGQIGVPESVPYLQKALLHGEIRVRKEALKALASIRTPEAVDVLCTCVDYRDIVLCKAALGWVAVIATDRAFPVLERLLTTNNILKMDSEVIRLAIEALSSIGSEPAMALIEKLSHTRHLFRRKKAGYIRETAAHALADGEGR